MARISVRDRLASALGRRDEVPNVELAIAVAAMRAPAATAAVTELVELLANGTKAERGDAVKVLYEIGYRDIARIAPHVDAFAAALDSRHGRVVWGAMIALDGIAAVEPDAVAALLPKLVAIADGDSVIARDHAVGILAQLAAQDRHRRRAVPALLAILRTCPDLQFPSYCERCGPVVRGADMERFTAIVGERMPRLPRPTQQKRVAKVLARLARGSKA